MPSRDQLSARDYEIAKLVAQGVLQQREIAKRVGMHYNSISRIIKQPAVLAMIDKLRADQAATTEREDLHAAINDFSAEAYRSLTWLAQHAKSEQVRLRAAETLMDRADASIAPKVQKADKTADEQRIVYNIHIDAAAVQRMQDFLTIMSEAATQEMLRNAGSIMPPSTA
jgi:predicted XRE-type DNA-binding protein